MDFSLSARLVSILGVVRTIVKDDVLPIEQKFLLGKNFRAIEGALARVRAKVAAEGLLVPQLAKEHGGAGLPLVEYARVSEELGRSFFGHYAFNCQAPDAGNMEILASHGTEEQKAQFLAPLVRGEARSCFSMTEPELPGSNPTWLATTARDDGDSFVIDGKKWFTSSADGAQFVVVMAVTEPDAPPHLRASQIIVRTDTPGFRIVRNLPVMGESGDGWPSHAEVELAACRVPKSHVLGARGAGFAIAQERLGPGRIHHCMRWVGICERAFELMCARAASRELSPGKPLGMKQIPQEWIAESRAEIDAARLVVMHAAWKMQCEGAHAARTEISTIKFFVAGVLGRVLDRAIQMHGALGMTDDTPLAYLWRHERAARIYDGADEVHKSVVAKRILKDYGLIVT